MSNVRIVSKDGTNKNTHVYVGDKEVVGVQSIVCDFDVSSTPAVFIRANLSEADIQILESNTEILVTRLEDEE